MSNLRRVGQEAEDRAADFLIAKGLTVVTRRFKAGGGEIDLVCMDGPLLVFVEVKLRRSEDSAPEESVGITKAHRMRSAASEYVRRMGLEDAACRFDVVAIDGSGIRHHLDVFAV